MIILGVLGWLLAAICWLAWRTAARKNYVQQVQAMSAPPEPTSLKPWSGPDPGKQVLEILQRGENCDWYSIQHSDESLENHDGLEIYWRTEVEHPEQNLFRLGRGPFELKAGFRVRWRVAATHHSYVEAVGLDLMTTILEARERADKLVERTKKLASMEYKHSALEAWKANGAERKYGLHGLDIDKWHVRLDYPGGLAWAESPELDQAVAEALAKAPQP